MDLSTKYMGITLDGPFIVGASPMSDTLDSARALEDAGASALVMRSLFEEQIRHDEQAMHLHTSTHEMTHAEALSYFPEPARYSFGPEAYLEHLEALVGALEIPIFASLNGVTAGGWVHYAQRMEEAGAAGIELNIYHIASDPDEGPREVEQRYIDVLRAVKAEVSVPVAVKLSPFFSAPVHMARALDEAGADGLVLFNRFYQPNIDIETLEVVPVIGLSSSQSLLLRLRWLAAISGQVQASLVATGGVHTGKDAIKALMAGAHGVQMASALLIGGPAVLAEAKEELGAFLEENEYESLAQMIGSMSLERCPDPAAFERGNYMKVLQSIGDAANLRHPG